MKNKLIYPFLLLAFFSLLMFSCESEDLELLEATVLEQYIQDNNITVEPTASGMYYIETKKGNGVHPTSLTQTVKVKYTGKLLRNGVVFDSTADGESISFPLGGVILGWQEGLRLMKEGGTATLIIPSSIAYGPSGQSTIGPYETLIFEVELVDVY